MMLLNSKIITHNVRLYVSFEQSEIEHRDFVVYSHDGRNSK